MSTKTLIKLLDLQCALFQRNEEWRETPVTRDGGGRFASRSGETSSRQDSSQNSEAEADVVERITESLSNADKNLEELGRYLSELPQKTYDKIKDLLDSKNMKKAREAIVVEVEKVDSSAAKTLADSMSEVQSVIDRAETPQDLQKSIKEISQKKKPQKIPEAVGVAAATLASGLLLGPFGVVMSLGGYGVLKNFSIPNFQQKGGKFKQDKFLKKQEEGDANEKDIGGYLGAYMSGATSNLAYNACVGITALGALAIAAQIADPKDSSKLPWEGILVKKAQENVKSMKKVN
jgi:hypothetical protein